MPSEQHEYLSKLAARWAKKQGFPIVATNLGAARSREIVDVIAFRSSCSLMIDSKVSRSDFKADAKKPERTFGGVGTYRFYITPVDMVSPDELPEGWGLLFVKDKKSLKLSGPKEICGLILTLAALEIGMILNMKLTTKLKEQCSFLLLGVWFRRSQF